ncbi:MAG: transposase, partial [Eubacteriaceae bacterium]|nr:transposase [Eubacteriaceae bacterium]
DVCNNIFVGACVQDGRKKNECRALCEMVDASEIKGPAIVLGDRGYECFNNFAHIENKGWKYAVRAKDVGSNGILSKQGLPSCGEFDIDISIALTRKQTKETKGQPGIYKILMGNQAFDYLGEGSEYYLMSFRAVRLELSDGSHECLITNLSRELFAPSALKELYAMRWGEEVSFGKLKYAIGLTSLHSKIKAYTVQEIYASLTMYNFCEQMASSAAEAAGAEQQASLGHDAKYAYKPNFTAAVKICKEFIRHFIRNRRCSEPPNAEKLISIHLVAVRPGRKCKRAISKKTGMSFNYRVA